MSMIGIGIGNGAKSKVIGYDSANRPDNVNVGNMDTGQVWTKEQGSFGVSGNKIYCVTNTISDSINCDFGISDCVVSCLCRGSNSRAGLRLRAVNDLNRIAVVISSTNFISVIEVIEGVVTQIASVESGTLYSVEHEIKCILKGSNLKVLVNGVQKIDVGVILSGTKHGIYNTSDATGATWDNFLVEGL